MTEIEGLPSAAALRAYMAATGWAERTRGEAGSLWTSRFCPAGFGVPHEDDPFLLRGAVERLAKAEGRTAAEVTRTILAVYGAPGSTQDRREASPSLAADRAAPTRHGQPETRPWPVSEEMVDAALAALIERQRDAREAVWVAPSRAQVRVMLEAAAPLIAAPRLTAAECDRLHEMVTGYGDAIAAIGRALESAAQPGGADCGLIASAWEALRVIEGSEEDNDGR